MIRNLLVDFAPFFGDGELCEEKGSRRGGIGFPSNWAGCENLR